ncbi:hypothetical protein QEN19_002767 [Hanseniaspora menglaensis]
MGGHNINIDSALDLLNDQIKSIADRISNEESSSNSKQKSFDETNQNYSGNKNGNKLYININQFRSNNLTGSDDEDVDEDDDEDIIRDTTITNENSNYNSSKNKLFKTISNHSCASRTSLSSILLNDDLLNTARVTSDKVHTQPTHFPNSYSNGRRDSNENTALFTNKPLFTLGKENSKLKNSANHVYLDSGFIANNTNSCNNSMSNAISSPFVKQTSHCGSSPFLSNHSSPFNKGNHMFTGSHHGNSGTLNNVKRGSMSTSSSFKRSASLKRSSSLKKHTNSNNNIYTASNSGINYNGSNTNSSSLITNLQGKLELDIKNKQQQNLRSTKNNINSTEHLDETFEFISKQPPPPLLVPYSTSSNNQISLLSSSNTGSSINSSSSNQFGLFTIDSNEEKRIDINEGYLDSRNDLNKTPIVATSNKMPPKTPDQTNNLLYKLNTDLNFETESVEIMSAMSQTSFASNPAALKYSSSLIFNKNDLLKMSGETALDSPKQTKPVMKQVEDQQLKQIIHLPTVQDKFKYNSDGITLIDGDFLKNMIYEKKHASFNDLLIIDCRFPKEYEQGHIKNSINVFDFDTLVDILKKMIATVAKSDLIQNKIVLYCEFSQYRSPKMGKFLRKLDRLINLKYWPYLIFPDLFILQGGICDFKKFNASLVTGRYCTMNDSYLHNNDELDFHLKVFKDNVDNYLGSETSNYNKNISSDYQSFDKMVYVKNEIMKVINESLG